MKTLLLTALVLTVSQTASANYWERAKEVFYPKADTGYAVCSVKNVKDQENIITVTETSCLIRSVDEEGTLLLVTTMTFKAYSSGAIETTTNVKFSK